MIIRQIRPLLVFLACVGSGCGLLDYSTSPKTAPQGLIATPPTYYSTSKARYLGTKYKDNLDRLVAHITRNSSTSRLEFANNISSVGGIGFFTHSAAKSPDERFLEVVLATPETFETKGEYSEKVSQLFARYGKELLGILAGDTQIYQDKDLSGYGLNFTWRTMVSDGQETRTTMARAIIYFQKEKVSGFLRRELAQADLLHDAVIFAVEEDGPLNLVSYQPRETKPDFRPAIREDNLAAGTAKPLTAPLNQAAKGPGQNIEAKLDAIKKDAGGSQDTQAKPVPNKPPLVEKGEVKAPAGAEKRSPPVSGSGENVDLAADKAPPIKRDAAAEKIAVTKRSGDVPPVAVGGREAKAEPVMPPAPAADRADQSNIKAGDPRPSVPLPGPKEVVLGTAKTKAAAPNREETKVSTAQPANAKQVAAKPGTDAKTKPAESVRPESTAMLVAPSTKSPVSAPTGGDSTDARLPSAVKLDNREAVIEPSAAVAVAPAPKAMETPAAPAPAAREQESEAPSATKAAALRQAKPLEFQPNVDAERKPALKERAIAAAPQEKTQSPSSKLEPVAKAPTPTAISSAEPTQPLEVKKSDVPRDSTATGQVIVAPAAPATEPPVSKQTAAPQAQVPGAPAVRAKPDAAATRKVAAPKPEIAKVPEVKAPAEPAFRPAEKLAEPTPARKIEIPTPVSVAKAEPLQAAQPEPVPSIAAVPEKATETPAPERLALLKKPAEITMEKKPLARPRSLEGFIIQMAFNDKEKAQAWADKMQQRGYAISVTEAGAEGALRVRLGNFSVRDEAERQLRNFKQEGMTGIIINLPQAFRPEARSSVP